MIESYAPFSFDTLVWRWPIAVYLFLVGISVGAVTFSVFLKRKLGDDAGKSSIIKSTAILGPLMIVIGLTLLIFDLVRPWMFWKLMIHYQWTSVMAIGVMLFQLYMVVLIIWLAGIYRNEIEVLRQRFLKDRFSFIKPLLDYFVRHDRIVEAVLLVFAVMLGAYTGFLLSVLKSYPMLNNPVLPALFLVSGLSSGIAAPILMALVVFKEKAESPDIAFLHRFEVPVVLGELFLLVCLFAGLYYGGGQKVVALLNALTVGFWAQVFWIGVLLIGIVAPLTITLARPHSHGRGQLLLVCCLSLTGIFALRFFILYGGQLTTL